MTQIPPNNPMLAAAIRVLVHSGEQVHATKGACVVNGEIQTYEQVIEYANDLYRAEKNMPLHARACLIGRPKSQMKKHCENV